MRRLILTALATALVVCTTAFVTSPAQDKDDTELTKHMKVINTSMRKLRAALKNPERHAEALELVLSMQEHALASKKLEPELMATIKGEDEKKKFLIDYRKSMHEFINHMFTYEVAILEGDIDAAKAVHKKLLKGKSPAHKKFKIEK